MTTRPTALPPDATRLRPATGRRDYFLLRRWTRVFFSSLRCFFLAIRLRRFLMTEPTGPLRLDGRADRLAGTQTPRSAGGAPGATPGRGAYRPPASTRETGGLRESPSPGRDLRGRCSLWWTRPPLTPTAGGWAGASSRLRAAQSYVRRSRRRTGRGSRAPPSPGPGRSD